MRTDAGRLTSLDALRGFIVLAMIYMLLFYIALMLLWRQGGAGTPWFYAGAAPMLFLLLAFRGTLNGEFDRVRLQHSWWGILGMIGWA